MEEKREKHFLFLTQEMGAKTPIDHLKFFFILYDILNYCIYPI
jgi:hypothetical protein